MMIGYQNPNGLDFYDGMMDTEGDFVVYKGVMFCAEWLQTLDCLYGHLIIYD